MTRFRDIVLNEEEGTVEIGAGLTWTDVFSYLVPKGLNVVGGRFNGDGVGGFILGGGRYSSSLHHACSMSFYVVGYSWMTNQYGLTIDTVTAFELVLPNGTVKEVTDKDEDLWFALRVRSNMNALGKLSDSDLKGWPQQLRELLEKAITGRTKTTFLWQGIVSRFTLKTYKQDDVWVCPLMTFFIGLRSDGACLVCSASLHRRSDRASIYRLIQVDCCRT